MDGKLKFGLPKGSLNDPERGNTYELLTKAGYEVKGYLPKNERMDLLSITNDSEIELRLIRPQNARGDLKRKLYDIAIIGDDWVLEESDIDGQLIKLANLEYGEVDIVVAVPEESASFTLTDLISTKNGDPLVIYTEYTKMTRDALLKNSVYQGLFGNFSPVIEVRGFRTGENEKVQIIYSEGTTESYLKYGFPIVETVQTKESLRRAGGRILEDGKILSSSAGLYARPDLDKEEQLWGKANEIKDMLIGVLNARKSVDVKFNVIGDTGALKPILEYIERSKLSLNGPTVSEILGSDGIKKGFDVNITVSRDIYPQVTAKLKKLGADGIINNTMNQIIL